MNELYGVRVVDAFRSAGVSCEVNAYAGRPLFIDGLGLTTSGLFAIRQAPSPDSP